MYGIYGDIIDAAQRALAYFEETEELLEYPEVQADKAEYLSVLSRYNHLKFLRDKLSELITALEEEKEVSALLSGTDDEKERAAIYEEITSLKKIEVRASASLSEALGCKYTEERAYCRFKLQEGSAKFGTALFSLIKAYLISNGAKVKDEKLEHARGGYVREISFVAEGAGVITRLSPLTGTHRVYFAQGKSEEICFAVTPAATVEELNISDLKIDIFHSAGAGGQNINKVETAVRITHLPTGLVVVCQDERSQLKNKKRALETIEKRLKEKNVQAEKERIEADIRARYSIKNTPISFDAGNNTFTDTRLKGFIKIPFPLSEIQFTSYINGLIAL